MYKKTTSNRNFKKQFFKGTMPRYFKIFSDYFQFEENVKIIAMKSRQQTRMVWTDQDKDRLQSTNLKKLAIFFQEALFVT